MPGLSDADVFGSAPIAPPQAPPPPHGAGGGPITVDNGRGITVTLGGFGPPEEASPQAPAPAPTPAPSTAAPHGLSDADVFGAPQAQSPSIHDVAADTGKSFLTGLANAGTNLTDVVMQANPIAQLKQMLGTAAALGQGQVPQTTPFHGFSQIVDPALHQPETTAGHYAQAVGQMIPNVVAPGGLLRKAAAVVLPGIGSEAAGQTAEALGANPTVAATARFLGGAAGGLASGVGVTRPALAPTGAPTSLEDLRQASADAWSKVDASGFRFPKQQVRSVAADISKLVAGEGGKPLYPTADAMARRIKALAASGDLSVEQLNRLRSQVGDKLMQPGSTEAHVGGQIKDKLDSLIETSNDPNIADARDLYTRLKKADAVSKRLESADLRSSSTYSGGNYTNAVRQQIRPLIDPTSKQRIRNLKPGEADALRGVVEGTRAQNALREISKLLGNRFVQTGAMMVTPHGIGFPLMDAAAKGVRKISEGQTEAAVQRAMDLMIAGGHPAPAGAPKMTYLPTGLEPFNLGTLLSLSRPAPSLPPTPAR